MNKSFFDRLITVLGLILFVMLIFSALSFFMYLFVIALVIGLVVLLINYIRFKFFDKKPFFQNVFIKSTTIIRPANKSGRTIDHDKLN